jgi:hypothetical protein
MSSEILFQLRQYNEIDLPFRNVTKIQFGVNFDRRNGLYSIHFFCVSFQTNKLFRNIFF